LHSAVRGTLSPQLPSESVKPARHWGMTIKNAKDVSPWRFLLLRLRLGMGQLRIGQLMLFTCVISAYSRVHYCTPQRRE